MSGQRKSCNSLATADAFDFHSQIDAPSSSLAAAAGYFLELFCVRAKSLEIG